VTDFRKFFDKDFLKAYDLDGKDTTVTIEKVVGGEVTGEGGKKSKNPIASFVGARKRFVLNSTNGKTIASLYGNDVSAWKGKRITLYPTTTKFGSETRECIRVRPKVPGSGPDTPMPDVQPPSEEVQA
jgi:hypothetical protein